MKRNQAILLFFLFIVLIIYLLYLKNMKKEQKEVKPTQEKEVQKMETSSVQEALLDVCQGPIEKSESPQEKVIGGKRFKFDGYRAELLDKDPDKKVKFGVISDIKNSIEATLENLRFFIDEFKKEGVEAIIVTGDIGTNYEEIKTNFDLLASSDLPVLVIIGNREGVKDFNRAYFDVNAVRGNLINLNMVRLVDWDDADLISVPGYFDKTYIHHPDGCSYSSSDIEAIKPLISELNDIPILISHGPLKTEGVAGIDYAVEAGNIGNPELTKFIKENNIPFGLFGNVIEAGGKAVSLSGKVIIPESHPSTSFYLNPGSANSDPWSMNDNTVSYGMSAIFNIDGKYGSYRILRRSPPSEGDDKS